ncbi:hypothetical protein MHYP_G00018260 [Metynnis hypsauchen]
MESPLRSKVSSTLSEKRRRAALRYQRETGAGLLKVFAGQYLKIQDHMLQHKRRHSVIENNLLLQVSCARFSAPTSPLLHTAVGFTGQHKGSSGRRPHSPEDHHSTRIRMICSR